MVTWFASLNVLGKYLRILPSLSLSVVSCQFSCCCYANQLPREPTWGKQLRQESIKDSLVSCRLRWQRVINSLHLLFSVVDWWFLMHGQSRKVFASLLFFHTRMDSIMIWVCRLLSKGSRPIRRALGFKLQSSLSIADRNKYQRIVWNRLLRWHTSSFKVRILVTWNEHENK